MNNRIGEINYNNLDSKMTIVEYKNSKDIIVLFDNGYKTKATYQQFKNRTIRNPYDKSIYNIGYIGEGIYKTTVIDNNKKHTIQYKSWSHLLERCYDKKSYIKHPTYENCAVCNEWHNFQNFAKWYDENYYTVDDERTDLDKDILHKGNKIYSPEKCIFVPQGINSLFTKRQNYRGDYPIGVSYRKRDHVYQSQCSTYNINNKSKLIWIGSFSSIEEAFKAYKNFKENHIKEIANEYKNKIPKKLYNALYEYKVEITD